MSTPNQKVKLYYKVVGDNMLKRAVRYIAAKFGYCCIPNRYVLCIEKCADDAEEASKRKNPLRELQLKSKAKAYREIAEEIRAFQEYKPK